MMQVLYDKLNVIRFSESGEKNYREIPGLLADMDHNQRILLFDKLITKGFIHPRTHKESFLAAFGEPIELIDYYPVKWIASSKQSFRELVEEFIKPITNEMIRDIETLFIYKGKPLKLNKADKNSSGDAWVIHKIADEVKAS